MADSCRLCTICLAAAPWGGHVGPGKGDPAHSWLDDTYRRLYLPSAWLAKHTYVRCSLRLPHLAHLIVSLLCHLRPLRLLLLALVLPWRHSWGHPLLRRGEAGKVGGEQHSQRNFSVRHVYAWRRQPDRWRWWL